MFRLYIFILLSVCVEQVFGQGNICSKTDTNLCYIKEKHPTSKFTIEKKYESVDSVYPRQTPLLADMDGDCIPEFIAQASNNQKILIIDSKTGSTKWGFTTPYFNLELTGLAVADIDGDGIPEIFFEASKNFPNPGPIIGRLFCYHADGKLAWISDERGDLYTQFSEEPGGTPALADFNQDGIPEIYVNNKIFNARTGIKLADGGANGIGREGAMNFGSDALTIAAQLDEDSTDLELAAGFTVYKIKINNINGLAGNSMTPLNIQVDNTFRDGFTTVADINLDGRLDIIVTSPGLSGKSIVYAYTLSNGIPQLIAKAYPPSIVYTGIGPPFIGDIKGAGKPSILFTRFSSLLAFSYNGTTIFQPDWIFTTTDSSAYTGLSMFDFNNDGINKIVYRDETNLSIIDGSGIQPKVIAKFGCYSWTSAEYPIIGDIDHTGHAKICIPCGFTHTGDYGKLCIFGPPDSIPGWAPARGIWNQYNYHVLNINDDLTIPRVEKNNATYKNGKYNNFFVQESLLDNGMYFKKAASLTGNIKCINYDPKNDEYTVIFDIYNRADASFSADSSLPVSFYNGDPEATGALIGIYYTLKKMESGDSLLNLVFKFSVSNVTDLFMVINTTRNGSGQFNTTDFKIAECDYTDNTFHTLDFPKIERLNATICKGGEYNFFGTLIHDAGEYYNKLSTIKGCDSLIYIMELITVDTVYAVQSIKACDKYNWNGKTYLQSGTFVYDTINSFGCDSITTLDLIINNSNSINIPHTACDSFSWNSITYDKSGNYPYQAVNIVGCDSTTTLELIINKSDNQLISHTACNSYFWNGHTYTQSGLYKFDTLNRFGCDSTVALNLSINSVINATIVNSACDSYNWNGLTYTQSGNYQYKTVNGLGCDSITTLQLTINKTSNSNTALSACDSYIWNGQAYTQSGNYQFKTLNVAGCDSVATIQLTINKSTSSNISQISCDIYNWNGQSYTQSGTYQYKTLNATGCDSIATLQLTLNNSDKLQINQTICDSYTWNGNTYDKSGIYEYKTVNVNGCDSTLNLNLTINKSSQENIALSVCDSLSFLGKTLKANGIYAFMIQNAYGCDSLINLNLNIRSEIHNNTATNCDTFKWNINGITYNQSGVYLQKYTNSFGCDSIYKLDLNIFKNFELVDQAEACKEYFWPVNKALLKQSGEYTYPLKTCQGCDSIIRLNLIVNHDFEKRDTVITDTAYNWPINHQIYTLSGTYQEHFTSTGGCDSIHYLILTIKNEVGIYYPNVIHPGDINGWFTLFDNGKTIALISSLSIYDRWGNLVWQKKGFIANELPLGWDGRFQGQQVVPGVYAWHALLMLRDGNIVTKKGDVTVIR